MSREKTPKLDIGWGFGVRLSVFERFGMVLDSLR